MSLYDDILSIFRGMGERMDGDDRPFSNDIILAVQTSLESGNTIGTVYNGTCSLGTSPGTMLSVSSSINGSAGVSTGQNIVYNACIGLYESQSGSDDIWVQALVDGCSAVVTTATIIEQVTGTVIPPSMIPPTIPASGTGEGKINDSGPKAALYNTLMTIPSAVGYSGDDTIIARIMSDGILTYLKACTCNFSGQGPLAGLTGTNTMKGNI